MKQWMMIGGLALMLGTLALPASAQDGNGLGSRLKQWRETREARQDSKERVLAGTPAGVITETYEGRDILVHAPKTLPASGSRAMIVVLHGGMGNAGHIQRTLSMDGIADKNGFVIAYLNGAPATRTNNDQYHAWNAGGGCCGQPSAKNIDDVAYITGAVRYLTGKYGIDPQRIYGMGHSNGAMMTQRLMCETDLYQAAMPVSGSLQLDTPVCKKESGKHILAIHGAEDINVPIKGGYGTKGVSNVNFKSQESSKAAFEKAGVTYKLMIVPGVDHNLASIDATLKKQTGLSLTEKAVEFFHLNKTP